MKREQLTNVAWRIVFLGIILVMLAMVATRASSEGHNIKAHEMAGYCSHAIQTMDGGSAGPLESSYGGMCVGYVRGVAETANLSSDPIWCGGDGITIGQFIRVYVKWMSDHPEKLHEDALKTMLAAWVELGMCQWMEEAVEG